ncbi:enhancer of polycomb-like-domain-containing protein [Phycomyces blakesleeanus]|uniref:Enhancer of polycomb-like protein n=1 Tax=Phycomyces blakesleeanus TaxID=4837 RepID=A0ABR3BES0_PHYBL
MTNQMISRMFRVKKLSNKIVLPVYKDSDLPDLVNSISAQQRTVPQIETGVEKEEEEEHDLQAAISAAQAAVTTGAKIESFIPTPDASRTISEEMYLSLYKKKFIQPSTNIRFSSTVEDTSGCTYVVDEEDISFLTQFNVKHSSEMNEVTFENIMHHIEAVVEQNFPHLYLDPSQVPAFNNIYPLFPEHSNIRSQTGLEQIYLHWKKKCQHRQGRSIIPRVRHEDLIKGDGDPYVCFRRRETKALRKTRQSDQHALDRLRKLRTQMENARNLLEMVLRREKHRKESLVLEHTVFDSRCKLRAYQRQLGINDDEDIFPVSRKKHRLIPEEGFSGTTIKIPLNRLKRDNADKSGVQLAIESDIARKRDLDSAFEDITARPYNPFSIPIPCSFYQKIPLQNNKCRYRKRAGRGGRIFLDRSYSRQTCENMVSANPHQEVEIYNRFQFDSDPSDNEDIEEWQVDQMNNNFLGHRVKLLSELELRNLAAMPVINPSNTLNFRANQGVPTSQKQSDVSGGSNTSSSSPSSSPLNNQTSTVTSQPIKRQNSRARLTPQQAAVAMANDMLVANMTAVVNSSGQNRTVSHFSPTQWAFLLFKAAVTRIICTQWSYSYTNTSTPDEKWILSGLVI